MKTAIPIYTNLTLTQPAAYKSQVVCVDLYTVNAGEMFIHVKLANGAVSPQQGTDFDVHYSFSPFDFRDQLANVPDICGMADEVFEISLQGGANNVKVYSSLAIPVEARYLYVWLNYGELSDKHNATMTVNAVAMLATNSESTTMWSTRRESTTLSNQLLLKEGPGVLYNLYGYNTKESVQFVQLFDSATLPADGTPPIAVLGVDRTDNFGLDIPVTGIPFTNGLIVCNSLQPATKQLGLADCFFYATLT